MFRKKKLSSNQEQVSLFYFWYISFRIYIRKNVIQRFKSFKSRRPHRSFKISKRKDYARPLNIGGYWSLVGEVFDIILKNKIIFRNLIIISAISGIIFIGLMDQNFISSLQAVVDTTNGGTFEGFFGEIGKAGLIISATFSSGGLIQSPNEVQQFIFATIILFIWLATVQVCRNILSGRKNFKLRDALYSCGAPIVPMTVIAFVILAQLIPAFIGIIIGSAARATGMISNGVEQMVFFAAMLLLFSISAFWVMGSLFAMIIVTIPGTYPLQALKIAGNMVSQRRLEIVKRIMFLLLNLILIWAIIMVPIVMVMNWLISISDLFVIIPIVPISMLLMSCFSCVFISVYIYILYRKVFESDQK